MALLNKKDLLICGILVEVSQFAISPKLQYIVLHNVSLSVRLSIYKVWCASASALSVLGQRPLSHSVPAALAFPLLFILGNDRKLHFKLTSPENPSCLLAYRLVDSPGANYLTTDGAVSHTLPDARQIPFAAFA